MFKEKFDDFALVHESITCEVEGFTVTARIEHDEDYHINDDDCHCEDQSVTGCNDEQHAKHMAARRAWFNDRWYYCGIVLSVSKNGVTLDDSAASLWAIECNYPGGDNAYLSEVANELLPEALEAGKAVLKKLTD